ncbi:nucleotide pyrophosphohydrolase [Desulfopila sp. IMCC35006]|uniref:MazG nucleotide pyrophosphohydrolase domain-containing protein n=1 Tax=Desulfopila sp. IMCC35006 TaxID=2569542 RepID=UPI0010AC49E2|nr:MazG nucleotide pyrophosphohydrolase domain-containing protein [Desulfopila sp. IMCC35006]TKB27595.1 nucleotide pyrophosphohydrolase [Desulfopila sp. IMCC35006]
MTNCDPKLSELISTIKTLRGEDGCPWDRRQNHISLLKYLKSECQELIDAIENDDPVNICEELGDLLYLIVMISEIGNDQGNFDLSDVLRTVNEKLIRRHPHVFAGQPYENEEQLAAQWEAIKAEEKKKNTV